MTFRESFWLEGLTRDEATGTYRFEGMMTGEQFREARGHVGRNDGPALLYDLSLHGQIDVNEHPGLVADVWCMAEFPSNLMDTADWVSLFEDAGYTVDEKPAPRPGKPVEVYRGCHHERRFGMSWSTDVERARWFAQRNLGQGTGRVYRLLAQPHWLLAYIGDGSRGESEFVVDPDYLNDEVVTLVE